jgi:asparagine synthase (glutamine-hydrolysing)
MNIIFGIWRPKGARVEKVELNALAGPTERFAEDGLSMRTALHIGMGAQAHHTDDRSRLEMQPAFDSAGRLLVYDGRLDNHADLQRELDCDAEVLADTEIVLRAYQRWGRDCFVRFIGDWSLSLWDAVSRTLYLARDHAGTRTLYYSRDGAGTVIWSTYLDSFLVTGRLGEPDPQYIASYLAMLPVYGRSPYREVQAILPGHFLAIKESDIEVTQFWTPMVKDQIIYKSDDDYKAQFLCLLEQAVARRDGPGAPRVAQLSGGMDSSSIVCLSDRIRTSQQPGGELIDTLSYYDDSEPSWNERPHFTLVETLRGKSGTHMDASRYRSTFAKPSDIGARYLYPGIDESSVRQDIDLRAMTPGKGYRSILSGIGGDELTGGIPDPTTGLADYLARGSFISGIRHSVAWCISDRTCLVDSFVQSVGVLAKQTGLAHLDRSWSSIPWLSDTARQLCRASIRELPLVVYRPFRSSPNAVDACQTWWYTLRTQPHLKPSEVYRYEYRYPYLDRDLVEYLLRVPGDQLARPGRRRYMMRSALKGIVPNEVLERRRKGYLLGSALKHIATALAPRFDQWLDGSLLADAGFIERDSFRQAFKVTTEGQDLRWWGFILRTISLETWLRVGLRGHRPLPTSRLSVDRFYNPATGQVPVP